MKKIVNLCLLALSFPFFTSCDHGFDNLNKSKTGATSIDPAFVLNQLLGSRRHPSIRSGNCPANHFVEFGSDHRCEF